MTSPELVIVGRLRKAHGVRGDVVVEPITDAPAEVFAAGRRLYVGTVDGEPDPDAGEVVVESVRPFKGGFIVHFDVLGDRNRADLWRNRYVLAPLAELPPPAEGEIYIHDLVGMRVVLSSGEALGEVLEVYELPQGLVLDVSRNGRSVVLPYQDHVVREVDAVARRIVVEPPPGLLD